MADNQRLKRLADGSIVKVDNPAGLEDFADEESENDESETGLVISPSIFDDPDEDITFKDQKYNIYTEFQIVNTYARDEGRLQLPIAEDENDEDSSDCEIVQVHRPFGQRIVHWTAKRELAWPQVPNPYDIGDGDVLMSSTIPIGTKMPLTSCKGYLYQLSGTYVYAQVKSRKPGTDDFPTSTMPYTTDELSENTLSKDNFVGGLVGDEEITFEGDFDEPIDDTAEG